MLLILHSFIPCVASAPWQREVADVGGTLGFVIGLHHSFIWLLHGGSAFPFLSLTLLLVLSPSRSYVFSSLATSAVSFATGALGMWIPLYLHRAQVVQKTAETCSSQPCGTKDR